MQEKGQSMDEKKENSVQPNNKANIKVFIIPAILMILIGWGGLFLLIFFTLPTLGMRWLFFFFAVIAITGTVMPLIAFLHIRFPAKPPVPVAVIVRESLWVGAYFPMLAWLQIGRVLTAGLAILIAVCMIAIEWAIRLRERSRWNPGADGNP